MKLRCIVKARSLEWLSLLQSFSGSARTVSILATLVVCLPACATNWYVSTTGNDTNSGWSPYAPFAHIQTALNRPIIYGDVINIEAGVYREQVCITNSPYGTGSLSNMVTIQAWDTNGDGVIESNEMPTITAAQSVTNWTAVTDSNLWAALTGLTSAQFQPNSIYLTSWSPNDTVADPLELVLESDTRALQQTSWPVNPQSECVRPVYQPTTMTAGSFQYDYTNHILYVWRSDGNAPGPTYPIEAALLDSTKTATGCGNSGPFQSLAEYISLKNIRFRYCNGDAASEGATICNVVALPPHARMDGCDVQWASWGGISTADVVLTNCLVANCGGTAVSIAGGHEKTTPTTNTVVTACTLMNNNWRFPRQSNPPPICKGFSEGVLHILGYCYEMAVTNNVFMSNYQSAIHCDGAHGYPKSPIVIANNFMENTNFNPYCTCYYDTGGGIDLEVSSGLLITDNVVISAFGGISYSGSSSVKTANNLFVMTGALQPYNTNYGAILVLWLAPSVYTNQPGAWTNAAANNVVVSNAFASYYDSPVFSLCRSENAPQATPYGPLAFSNVFAHNLIWNYVQTRKKYSPPIQLSLHFATNYYGFGGVYTNVATFFQAAAGTDGTLQNVGNLMSPPVAAPGLLRKAP